ncbi:MAG: protein-disulfide reductase DsbD [Zoogloeaceae bacterium]|jgi:thiol:disulfide interchange protein DsbD|nr:protein-disulfide reductase DsbD [Zoogloeaceae bacterium]
MRGLTALRRGIWLALALAVFFCAALKAQTFLDPAVAFKPGMRALDARELEVRFEIAPGYYLYRDKFRFAVDADAPVTLGDPVLPEGREKEDEVFGKVAVFHEKVAIRLPVTRRMSGPLVVSLRVTSQGCAEAGLCYPPRTETLVAELPAEGALPVAGALAEGNDESSRIAARLENAGFWINLLLFFLAGLLLAFTPCVLPMIPILSGIIAGQGGQVSRRRGLTLSLLYVLGMALAYTLAGVAAGLTGALLSAALQNAWVLAGFAGVFILLALSMFGFYELQLPAALQSLVSEESGRIDRRSRMRGLLRGLGVFGMGALSALIVGPCVAAPLAGALLYIGKTGDALLGGAALFAMALGMGAPLVAVGVSTAALPRIGPWMNSVKQAFGVMLLASAVWIVSPVIPVAAQMLAWAFLLIIPAMYLHALDPLPSRARGWMRFWKGVGVVMLLAGVALLSGLLGGSRDPLQPLRVFGVADGPVEARLPFERVNSLEALEARLSSVRQTDRKPVLLDFYADWCVACKEMERFTFNDPAVRERLGNFVLLRVDVTGNSARDQALLKRFQLFGPPGILFFDAEGQELPERVVGFQNAEMFLAVLERVAGRGKNEPATSQEWRLAP